MLLCASYNFKVTDGLVILWTILLEQLHSLLEFSSCNAMKKSNNVLISTIFSVCHYSAKHCWQLTFYSLVFLLSIFFLVSLALVCWGVTQLLFCVSRHLSSPFVILWKDSLISIQFWVYIIRRERFFFSFCFSLFLIFSLCSKI